MISLLDKIVFSFLVERMPYLEAVQWSFGISLTVSALGIYCILWFVLTTLYDKWYDWKESKETD